MDRRNTTETETAEATETATESDADEETDEDAVVDLSDVQDYERRIDELTEQVEAQQAEMEELRELLLDLSVRQADDRGMGVCPECHGPVEKVRRWFRPTVIKCRRCGEVFHES
jgi:RNA polymerase-binding transcription factor DksA